MEMQAMDDRSLVERLLSGDRDTRGQTSQELRRRAETSKKTRRLLVECLDHDDQKVRSYSLGK